MSVNYIDLKDFELYNLSRDLSGKAWKIYSGLDWRQKKIIGDQFISSSDSIGANIAESYGRYFFKDRLRFLYFARGSLYESLYHWVELLDERNLIEKIDFQEFSNTGQTIKLKLNNYISSIQNSIKKS